MTNDWKSLAPLDDETPKAYQAFLDYVALGPERSQLKLIAQYKIQQADGKSSVPTLYDRTLADWSVKYQWPKRITAYLAEQRSVIAEKHKERYLKLMDKQMTTYEKLDELLDTMLKEFQRLRVTKRSKVPDPADPTGQRMMETITLKANTADLTNLIKAVGDLQKNMRAFLGEKTTLELDTSGSADGKIKLYIGVSPDDWDLEGDDAAEETTPFAK